MPRRHASRRTSNPTTMSSKCLTPSCITRRRKIHILLPCKLPRLRKILCYCIRVAFNYIFHLHPTTLPFRPLELRFLTATGVFLLITTPKKLSQQFLHPHSQYQKLSAMEHRRLHPPLEYSFVFVPFQVLHRYHLYDHPFAKTSQLGSEQGRRSWTIAQRPYCLRMISKYQLCDGDLVFPVERFDSMR